MVETTVTELRRNLQRYLARVARGEEVRVTRRGAVVARVVGCSDARAAARETLRAISSKRAVPGGVESAAGSLLSFVDVDVNVNESRSGAWERSMV